MLSPPTPPAEPPPDCSAPPRTACATASSISPAARISTWWWWWWWWWWSDEERNSTVWGLGALGTKSGVIVERGELVLLAAGIGRGCPLAMMCLSTKEARFLPVGARINEKINGTDARSMAIHDGNDYNTVNLFCVFCEILADACVLFNTSIFHVLPPS